MYIGVSRLAKAAGGGSTKNDKKLIEAVNKALQHSSMVSQSGINKVAKELEKVIKSGNEEATILLKRQLDALKVVQELNKTGGADLAKMLQRGNKLTNNQYQSLDRYLEKMGKMSGELNSVLKTNLSEVSDGITKLVNGDISNAAKLQNAKNLAQVIGNSGLFDNSPAFKELLAFVKSSKELNEQSNKQLIELVDGMNVEVQAVDKLNDLIEITRDQSKSEKTQLSALDNIINTLGTSNRHLTELNQLKEIANASSKTSEKFDKLSPILKKLSDNTMQTRTLHTLQQLEFSMKKGSVGGLSPSAISKIKSGLSTAGSKAGGKLDEHKTNITKALLGKIPVIGPALAAVDMTFDGAVSDKIGDVAGLGGAYLGAKGLKSGAGKLKGLFKGKTATAVEETAGGVANAALRGGGSKGFSKLLSKGGKVGKVALAGLAAYELLSGGDAEAAPYVPNGVAAAPQASGANPLTEAAIYATAPKIAEKTGVSALGCVP